MNPYDGTEWSDAGKQSASPATFGVGRLALEIAQLNPLGIAVELIVRDPEADTVPPDLRDPDQLGSALAAACRAKGSTELFMPFCRAPDHSDTGDKVLDAGFWHGDMFVDYWGADDSAAAHFTKEPDGAGDVGVIRVRADTSTMVEWIVFN
jgi:hypothetical protein